MSLKISVWCLSPVLLLAGCTSFQPDSALQELNREYQTQTGKPLTLAKTAEARDALQKQAADLLGQPLQMNDAVALAVMNSPAWQARLAAFWASSAHVAQDGRLQNPVFRFERSTYLNELEITRALSLGLSDLLTLPMRQKNAAYAMDSERLQLAADVCELVLNARQAWVNAVAARERLAYAVQVQGVAQAASELAERMRKAGNFSRAQAAREQLLSSEAALQFSLAQQDETRSREQLLRLLGLDEKQAGQLQLPDRLPALPQDPLAPEAVAGAASSNRLDIRLATSELNRRLAAQGLGTITSLTDIEVSLKRNTVFDAASPPGQPKRAAEVAVRLPLFDSGDLQRDAMRAETLAASYRLESVMRGAASELREAYAIYRNDWEMAQHYRSVVLPLRQQLSEQNLLRYNGMLIGVFDLMSDAREQMQSVSAAISANQQFWLADARLQTVMLGAAKPATRDATRAE